MKLAWMMRAQGALVQIFLFYFSKLLARSLARPCMFYWDWYFNLVGVIDSMRTRNKYVHVSSFYELNLLRG